MNFIKKRILFGLADFETTGLTVHPLADLQLQPRPIEFAGILTDGVEILEEFEVIIDPGIAIEEIITKITGLTNEDLKGKPKFRDVVPQIANFLGKADAFVAHNASFDKAIMGYALARCGLTYDHINWPKYEICTVEQTFHQHGRRMKLSELYAMYCGPYVQKHRALDDIHLMHQLCLKLSIYEAFNGGRS